MLSADEKQFSTSDLFSPFDQVRITTYIPIEAVKQWEILTSMLLKGPPFDCLALCIINNLRVKLGRLGDRIPQSAT